MSEPEFQSVEDAIRYYESNLPDVRNGRVDRLEDAVVCANLGLAYLRRAAGDRQENLKAASRLIAVALTHPGLDVDVLVLLRRSSANAYAELGETSMGASPKQLPDGSSDYSPQYRVAVDYFEQALLLMDQPDEDPSKADLTLKLGLLCQNLAESENDLEFYRQAIRHWHVLFRYLNTHPDPDLRALANVRMGNARLALREVNSDRDLTSAGGYFRAALDFLTPDHHRILFAEAQIGLGKVKFSLAGGDRRANLDAALNHAQVALAILTEREDPDEWASAESLVAGALFQRTIMVQRATTVKNDDLQDAVVHFERALSVFLQLGQRQNALRMLNNLGDACLAMVPRTAHVEAAIRYFERALELGDQKKFPKDWLRSNLCLMRCHSDSLAETPANAQEAARRVLTIRYGEAALEVIEAVGTPFERARVHLSLAGAYGLEPGGEREQHHLERACESLPPQEHPRESLTAHARLGARLMARGHWAQAATIIERAIAAGELLIDRASTAASRQREVDQVARLYEQLAWCQLELGQLGEAFRSVEMGCGRLLTDALRVARDIGDRPFGKDVHADQDVARAVVLPFNTLEYGAAFVLAPRASAIAENDIVRLPGLVQSLDMITGARARLLNHQIDQETPDFQDLDETLDRLWKAIVSPVLERLRSMKLEREDPIVIQVSSGLGVLPLHAASCGTRESRRYFGDEWVCSYAPSSYARRLSVLRAAKLDRHPKRMLVVSNPTGDLPFAGLEAAYLTRILGPERSTTLGGLKAAEPATVNRVKVEASKHSYLHFACHGSFIWDDPLESFLLLANGERLTLSAVMSDMDLRAVRLVTLSACQSALGDVATTHNENLGFAAAFLQAGVATVIGSLWSVSDLSTSLLLERTYVEHLDGGSTPAVSLARAQRWLRHATAAELRLSELVEQSGVGAGNVDRARYWRAHPKSVPFSHPYYWAPFVVIGE